MALIKTEPVDVAEEQDEVVVEPGNEEEAGEVVVVQSFRTRKLQMEETRKEVVKMDFVHNVFPKNVSLPICRNALKIVNFSPKVANFQAVVNEDEANKCIFCNQAANVNGLDELISCQGKMSGISRKKKVDCGSKFHIECAMKYNGSSFLFQYAARTECQKSLLCPLHCCSACNVDRKKQSAYTRELLECALCFRAFHEDTCQPAGSKRITVEIGSGRKKWSVNMLVCSKHFKRAEVKHHVNHCIRCDDTDNLVKCRSCVRSFHQRCLAVKKVGGKVPQSGTCEVCLTDGIVRYNVPVVAKFRGKFYLGMTRPWEVFSATHQKLFKNIGYPGFTVVEWILENNTKTVVSMNELLPLDGFNVRMARSNELAEWERIHRDFEQFAEFPALFKEATVAHTVVYLDKNDVTFKKEGRDVCNCKGANKCSTSSCENVEFERECPPECNKKEKAKQRCQNRNISEKRIHPNMERRKAGKKGFGVFATGPIEQGEFLAEYTGEIINLEEKEKRLEVSDNCLDDEQNRYMFEINPQLTVDAAPFGNIARYINHSCLPNAECHTTYKFAKMCGKDHALYEPRLAIRAVRDILPDEEVTIDYNWDIDKECFCGMPNCSGKLRRGVRSNTAPARSTAGTSSSASSSSVSSTTRPKSCLRSKSIAPKSKTPSVRFKRAASQPPKSVVPAKRRAQSVVGKLERARSRIGTSAPGPSSSRSRGNPAAPGPSSASSSSSSSASSSTSRSRSIRARSVRF